MKKIILLVVAAVAAAYGINTGNLNLAALLDGDQANSQPSYADAGQNNSGQAAPSRDRQRQRTDSSAQASDQPRPQNRPKRINAEIEKAIADQRSDVQVRAQGRVIKLLRDDLEGSKHQKFIVKLPSGNTILIAHNIDLAPRINSLREGDEIEFYGEFEWNDRGGVVHWTHHDPRGRHAGGWIDHNGKRYE